MDKIQQKTRDKINQNPHDNNNIDTEGVYNEGKSIQEAVLSAGKPPITPKKMDRRRN